MIWTTLVRDEIWQVRIAFCIACSDLGWPALIGIASPSHVIVLKSCLASDFAFAFAGQSRARIVSDCDFGECFATNRTGAKQ